MWGECKGFPFSSPHAPHKTKHGETAVEWKVYHSVSSNTSQNARDHFFFAHLALKAIVLEICRQKNHHFFSGFWTPSAALPSKNNSSRRLSSSKPRSRCTHRTHRTEAVGTASRGNTLVTLCGMQPIFFDKAILKRLEAALQGKQNGLKKTEAPLFLFEYSINHNRTSV